MNIRNFRDLKGYVNNEGRKLKGNQIFRGGALNELSKEDMQYFSQQLNIKHVLDFRDEKEASLACDKMMDGVSHERISALIVKNHDEHGFDMGSMLQGQMTKEKKDLILAYVIEGYKNMAFNNSAYHQLFERLLENDGGVYFHCTAGKDRTGVACFLIMKSLGMNDEDCLKEYLLSNELLKESNEALCKKLNITVSLISECEPLLYVHKEYLDYTMQAIQEKYTTYEDFFFHEYNLTKEKLDLLKNYYLE